MIYEEYVSVRNEDYIHNHISEKKVIDRFKKDNSLDELKAKIVDVIMKGDRDVFYVYCPYSDCYEIRESKITYNNTEDFISDEDETI